MKKKLQLKFMVVLSLLAMTATVAAAPMRAAVITLIGAANDGGGVSFTFRVSEPLSKSQLKGGWVQVQGGDSFPLSCVQVDDETVRCTSSKKAGGQNVVVGFGGSTFWTYVPEAHAQGGGGGNSSGCYNYYDLVWGEEEDFWWEQGGETCEEPDGYGDTVLIDETWYRFEPSSDTEALYCPPAENTINEDAYYTDCD